LEALCRDAQDENAGSAKPNTDLAYLRWTAQILTRAHRGHHGPLTSLDIGTPSISAPAGV
jgi:hypothetical protein